MKWGRTEPRHARHYPEGTFVLVLHASNPPHLQVQIVRWDQHDDPLRCAVLLTTELAQLLPDDEMAQKAPTPLVTYTLSCDAFRKALLYPVPQ